MRVGLGETGCIGTEFGVLYTAWRMTLVKNIFYCMCVVILLMDRLCAIPDAHTEYLMYAHESKVGFLT